MIILLTGDDTTLIEQKIQYILKKNNLKKYSKTDQLKEAYFKCLTQSLIDSVTATVLQVSPKDLKLNTSSIAKLQRSQNLLFIVCENFDGRTKLGQALKPYLLSESTLPSNWSLGEIKQAIDYYAEQFGLNLSYEVKDYLLFALNNNFSLLRSGLETLALLSLSPSLELTKEIIPSVHATAIDLKEMILRRRREEISTYVTKLKAFTNEQAILTSLSTQFTLLMQTAIGSSQNLNDSAIVKLAEIKNPKRLYFLRKEVAQISIEQLIWLNQQIKDTQFQLRYHTCDLSARLMLMCCW